MTFESVPTPDVTFESVPGSDVTFESVPLCKVTFESVPFSNVTFESVDTVRIRTSIRWLLSITVHELRQLFYKSYERRSIIEQGVQRRTMNIRLQLI